MLADDVDLPAFLAGDGVTLYKVGRTWRGACPLHGGRNDTTFTVWQTPTGGWRWRCWAGCNNGESGDAITYVRLRYGVGFGEALAILGIDRNAARQATEARRARPPEPAPDAEPPSDQWRSAMAAMVRNAALTLWGVPGRKALEYLRNRGFTDATITRAGLGYTDGASVPGATIPAGIVIPHRCDGVLWRVTVRRLANDEPKYVTAAKSGNAPYLIDDITVNKPVVLVEGAFDALAIWQEAADLVTPVATGATGCRARRWLTRIALAPGRILAFDADQSGDATAAWWQSAYPDARRWRPAGGKDPADMLAEPGLVRVWIEEALHPQAKRTAPSEPPAPPPEPPPEPEPEPRAPEPPRAAPQATDDDGGVQWEYVIKLLRNKPEHWQRALEVHAILHRTDYGEMINEAMRRIAAGEL